MFLPVDNDGGDLLVHEEEDGEEEGGDGGEDVDVPRGGVIKHGNKPAPSVRSGWLHVK